MSPRRTSAALSLALGVTTALTLTAGPGTASAAPSARPFPDTIALKAGSRPEGIAAGPGTTFFAGSMQNGAVFVGDVRTGERRVLVPGVPDTAARGLQLDRSTGLLWVAGERRNPDGTTSSRVTAYDSRTGERVARVPVPGTRFLNDVQVGKDAVYVTDSLSAQLVRVTTDGATLLDLTGDYAQPNGGFGLNGIRQLPGGDLIVTSSSTGDLFRVDPATGRTTLVPVTGGDLVSGDGLELRGSTLYVVYGSGRDAVSVVELQQGGRSGRLTGTLTDPDLDRPTTAVVLAGSLYAVNGRFSTPPTRTTPYSVVEVALPGTYR